MRLYLEAAGGLAVLLLASALLLGAGRWGEEGPGDVTIKPTGTLPLVDNTLTSPTPIPGLSFFAQPNTEYAMSCYLVASADADTTAIRFSVSGPSTGSPVVTFRVMAPSGVGSMANLAATTFDFVHGVLGSGGTVRTITRLDMALINGSTAGTIQVTVDTEVVAPAFVQVERGSYCDVEVH